MASTAYSSNVNWLDVECEKLHALLGQLESPNCYEGGDTLRVRRLRSQLAMALSCCLFLLLPLESCEFFFFWKPCRSNRGPSRNSGWVHRNWGPFEEICMAQTTKLCHGGGFRKREHKALCMLTCMVTGQPHGKRWFELRGQRQHLRKKMQLIVGFWLCMYGYSSLHTKTKARENSKNS